MKWNNIYDKDIAETIKHNLIRIPQLRYGGKINPKLHNIRDKEDYIARQWREQGTANSGWKSRALADTMRVSCNAFKTLD